MSQLVDTLTKHIFTAVLDPRTAKEDIYSNMWHSSVSEEYVYNFNHFRCVLLSMLYSIRENRKKWALRYIQTFLINFCGRIFGLLYFLLNIDVWCSHSCYRSYSEVTWCWDCSQDSDPCLINPHSYPYVKDNCLFWSRFKHLPSPAAGIGTFHLLRHFNIDICIRILKLWHNIMLYT